MGHCTWADAGMIALRTLIVYIVLLLLVRAAGKREIGQMTPFDLIVLLLLSNAVQNAMTGPDTSVEGGVIAAVTLIVVNLSVSRVSLNWEPMRRFVDGVPIPLIAHGQVYFRNLKREGLTFDELMGALREHEVDSIDQVELAMLEIDGEVSVIRCDKEKHTIHHTRRRLKRHAKKP